MRQTLLLVTVGAALVALTGCPPAYPKCSSDDQCKEHNEVCVQGQCRECATDAQCKPGFICDGNRCVPKPACGSDGDCGPGKKCLNGTCTEGAKAGCSTNEDCAGDQECQNGTCVSSSASSMSKCTFEPIRFEFNKFNLTSDAERQLRDLADCMKKAKGKVTLEGHADDRGTEEFNMQLSNRRASSVKRYLSDLGVSANQMDTVGYGESRPFSSGQDEAAWAQNRRVEFKR